MLETTTSSFVIDLDDFCESNNGLDLLWRLYACVPRLRLNLFTIPGLCSPAFLNYARSLDWLDFIPHGWLHTTARECQTWSYADSLTYLLALETAGWRHGFKAPGWQISDGMYQALLERNWWVADQAYNHNRRPVELRAYLLDEPNRIHGHIGHLGGHNDNALELIFDQLAALRGEFRFIQDLT